MAKASPFTRAVVSSMRRLYPEALADKSFDNTGLLLEAPYQPRASRKSNSVLMTIDLTKAVADEAIKGNFSVVVAYHPIIFRGLKSLTLEDTQQSSLLQLAANGISVYSPHTAVDIVPGGMGDWLCDVVTGQGEASAGTSLSVSKGSTSSGSKYEPAPVRFSNMSYSEALYITPQHPAHSRLGVVYIPHSRSVVTPSPESSLNTANKAHKPSSLHTASSQPYFTSTNTGAGRLITFKKEQPLEKIIEQISTSLNNPKALQIALPQHISTLAHTGRIHTVGVCPGSGASVLRAAHPLPDLILTGEMSHHETLAVIERGGVVIALGHSNSERGYLRSVMREKLEEEISKEWNSLRKTLLHESGAEEEENEATITETKIRDDNDESVSKTKVNRYYQNMLDDESVQVVISRVDRDPYGVIMMKDFDK